MFVISPNQIKFNNQSNVGQIKATENEEIFAIDPPNNLGRHGFNYSDIGSRRNRDKALSLERQDPREISIKN